MAEEKEPAPEDLFDDGSIGSGSDAEEDAEPAEPPMSREEVAEALLAACKGGDAAECERMLEKMDASEVEFHASGSGTNDWTVLTWAASEGHEHIAKMLVKHGFGAPFGAVAGAPPTDLSDLKITSAGSRGGKAPNSPLLWAAYKGHERVLCTLASLGCSLRVRDECGNTALHLASTAGHVEVCRTLLGLGADTRGRNAYGNTPLKMATAEDVRALLLRAENTTADPLSGDAFSAKTPKVLCLNCDQFYAPSSTVPASLLREAGGAADTRRPCRLSLKCRDLISGLEADLKQAMAPTLPDGGSSGSSNNNNNSEGGGGEGEGKAEGEGEGAAAAAPEQPESESKDGDEEAKEEGKDDGEAAAAAAGGASAGGDATEGVGDSEGKEGEGGNGAAAQAQGVPTDRHWRREHSLFSGALLDDDDVIPLASALRALSEVGADASGATADADLLLLGRRVHAQLLARLAQRDELEGVNRARPLPAMKRAEGLVAAIAVAKEKDFDGRLAPAIAEAERVVRASAAEIRLSSHMTDAFAGLEAASAEHSKDIAKLDELLEVVRMEGEAGTALGQTAQTLLTRLRIEVALRQRIGDSAAARAESEAKEAAKAAALEEIEALKGKKKKAAKKAFEAEEAAVTSAMVQESIDGLTAKLGALNESTEAGADESLGVNKGLLDDAEEEKKWLQSQMAPLGETLEVKKAAEEKALAKKSKKKK